MAEGFFQFPLGNNYWRAFVYEGDPPARLGRAVWRAQSGGTFLDRQQGLEVPPESTADGRVSARTASRRHQRSTSFAHRARAAARACWLVAVGRGAPTSASGRPNWPIARSMTFSCCRRSARDILPPSNRSIWSEIMSTSNSSDSFNG